MRVLVQRAKNSSVEVDNKIVGQIEKGMVLFVGFTIGDSEDNMDYMIQKILKLRIFNDDNNIMNRNILEVGGEILSVSQFTLYADTKKGNRPSYINSLNSKEAAILYQKFNEKLSKYIKVESGIFQSCMTVSITNDGPITIMLER